MEAATREMCANQVPGDTYRNLVVDATFGNQTFKHILAPVWIMTYVYSGTSYQVLVNGVTGKTAGPALKLKIRSVIAVSRNSVVLFFKMRTQSLACDSRH